MSTEEITVVETKAATIVERLRTLLEVVEALQMNMSYVVVSANSNEVAIAESDFKKLFSGQTFSGVRRNSFVEVKSEFGGIMFTSSIYMPIGDVCREETLSL